MSNNARGLYRLMLRGYYYTGGARAHAAVRRHERSCTVLLYHGIAPSGPGDDATGFVDEATFERQMLFLNDNFMVVPLQEVASCLSDGTPLPSRCAAVTFDDGYRSVAERALPVLERLTIPFTIFATTGLIGQEKGSWWDRLKSLVYGGHGGREVVLNLHEGVGAAHFDLSKPRDRERLFTAARREIMASPSDEGAILDSIGQRIGPAGELSEGAALLDWPGLKRIAASPLVEIGSHTVSHPNLARIPDEDVRRELSESKHALERELGAPVRSFAYPFGERGTYTDRTESMLKEAGYERAVTGIERKISAGTGLYQLGRISISGDDPWPIFVSKTMGIGSTLKSLWHKLR